MSSHCLCEDFLQQRSEQFISLLGSEALQLCMVSGLLSGAYTMASVRSNQLLAPTGRLEASNTLLLLGVQGSNTLLTLRGEDGKRLPWKDDFSSSVREILNIKGLPLAFARMSGWRPLQKSTLKRSTSSLEICRHSAKQETEWIWSFEISTGHTVWWRSLHKSTLER